MDLQNHLYTIKQDHFAAIDSVLTQIDQVQNMSTKMIQCLQAGGKVVWFGNGGSAADAQHLAAELVVRYVKNRRALASIALTTDSSILTAHTNDYDFHSLFARQVEALVRPGDIVVGISTSGNSENVLQGLMAANAIGAITWGWTGAKGGKMLQIAQHTLLINSTVTARIQEGHIFTGHLVCDFIDEAFD